MSEENPMPKVTQFGVNTGNTLDTGKLLEVARTRHNYARSELSRLNMDFQVERTRLMEETRERMEDLERGLRQRLSDLEREYVAKMRPAKDMMDLVGKMLDQ